MFELNYWERVGLVLFGVGLVLLTAVIVICKLYPKCCLHRYCPLRVDGGEPDEKVPITSSIYTEYTPIPAHQRHLKESHPQYWSQIGSMEDAGKQRIALKTIKKQVTLSSDSETDQAPLPKEPQSTPSTNKGKLEFTLVHNQNANRLILNVKNILELPRRIVGGSYDVCLKAQLLGSLSKKTRRKQKLTREQILNNTVVEAQTKLHRRMPDIKMDETIEMNISKDQIRHHVLRLVLCEYDKYSRMEVTGDVLLPLVELDLRKEYPLCHHFQEPPEDPKGEILLSISHLPTAEKLSVVIMKLKDLKAPEKVAEVTGVYVKLTFIHRSRSLIRKKTAIRPFEPNKVINETLVFDIPGKQLKHMVMMAAVMCTVKPDPNESYDSDNSYLLASDVETGRVVFGYDASGDAEKHWTEMVQSPRKAVAFWHKLT